MTSHRVLRHYSALLCLLAACAAPTRKRLDQVVIPFEPLVMPEPIVLPAPVALPPPVPIMVHPQGPLPPPMQQEPGERTQPTSDESARSKEPPPAVTSQRPGCEPQPTPHLGGDALHNRCADTFPPNRFPGNDVLVDGKRFDALQVNARVLWEIKTDRFDEYSPFLRDQVIRNQVPELLREFSIARACGFDFVVGVSSAAHQTALRREMPNIKLVLTGC
jgi:hypothetical protein